MNAVSRHPRWGRLSHVLVAAFVITGSFFAGSALSGHTDDASAATRSDDTIMSRFAVPGVWKYMTKEAKDFGLGRLYPLTSESPFKYGRHDSTWYIGTYRSQCLVSIGYSNEYSELGLRGGEKLDVQVFNRYGPSVYLAVNEQVTYKGVAKFVARSAKRCL